MGLPPCSAESGKLKIPRSFLLIPSSSIPAKHGICSQLQSLVWWGFFFVVFFLVSRGEDVKCSLLCRRPRAPHTSAPHTSAPAGSYWSLHWSPAARWCWGQQSLPPTPILGSPGPCGPRWRTRSLLPHRTKPLPFSQACAPISLA